MPAVAAAGVALALALDAALGELPQRLHPVAWFGRLVGPFDRPWSHPVAVGVVVALVLPAVAAGVVGGAVAAAGAAGPLAVGLLCGLALFATTSRSLLVDTAAAVVSASVVDPADARRRAPALVGRDPTPLSPAQLRSAAVESAAENLADGLVAPLLAFGLLAPWSLPAAAGAAAWVKAVNTVDSMLGYQDRPVGWAGARLDDAVMWLPARLAAALLALVAADSGALIRARGWAGAPASPNSGWPMATLAAVLGVRLEKPGCYVLFPELDLPSAADASVGVHLVSRSGALAFAAAGVMAWS